MTALTDFLKQCRSIEAKATRPKWKLEHVSNCRAIIFIPTQHGDFGHLIHVDHGRELSDPTGDAEFIAFSRNNFMKLVEAVSVLSEAAHMVACNMAPTENIGHISMGICNDALEKCEEILRLKPEEG